MANPHNKINQGQLEKSSRPWFVLLLAVFHLPIPLVKAGIDGVEILTVKMILRDAEGVGEAVNMKYYCSFRIFS